MGAMTKYRAARAALLALAVGSSTGALSCAEDKPETKTEAKAVPQPKPDATKSMPLVEIAAPADFIVYGGADDLLKLLSAGDDLAKSLAPGGPSMSTMVAPAVQEQLALEGDAGLALDQPIRFAVLDPKAHADNSLVLMLSIKGRDTFEKALPKDHKKDDAGNALSWQAGGKTLYANFLGETLVLTPEKTTFSDHRKFLAELGKSKLAGGVGAITHMANIVQLYGKDLDDGLAAMKQQASQPALGGASQGALANVGEMFTWLGEKARELDKVEITGRATPDGVLLHLTVHPKAGSSAHEAFKSIEPGSSTLLAKLPADTAGVLSMSLKPTSLETLRALFEWSMSLGFAGAASDELVDASMEYWKSTNGEFAMAAAPIEGVDGLAFLMLGGVSDAEAARKSQRKIVAMYDDPAVKASYEKLGLKVSYRKAAYKIGDVEVDTSETKVSGDAAKNPGMAMMSSFMTTHTAITDDGSVLAYGEDGKKVLQAFLGGKVEGGLSKTKGVARAQGNAAEGQFLFAYLNTSRFAKAFATDDASMLVPAEGPGLAVSLGAKDGKLGIALDLPGKDVTGIMMLATQAQSALMGRPPGLGAPPMLPPGGANPPGQAAPGTGPGASPIGPGQPATLK